MTRKVNKKSKKRTYLKTYKNKRGGGKSTKKRGIQKKSIRKQSKRKKQRQSGGDGWRDYLRVPGAKMYKDATAAITYGGNIPGNIYKLVQDQMTMFLYGKRTERPILLSNEDPNHSKRNQDTRIKEILSQLDRISREGGQSRGRFTEKVYSSWYKTHDWGPQDEAQLPDSEYPTQEEIWKLLMELFFSKILDDAMRNFLKNKEEK